MSEKTVIEKKLHSMPYDKAQKAAEIVLSSSDMSEGAKTEWSNALASHPRSPTNVAAQAAQAQAAAQAAPAVDPALAALLATYPTKDDVLRGLAGKSLSIENASKVLSALTVTTRRPSGPVRPYTTKSGQTVQKNPNPQFLLLRNMTSAGKLRKVPTIMLFILPGKEIKGKGYAGSMMVPEPVLRALVEKHAAGGIFAAALAAYDNGSICVSREKDGAVGESEEE